MLGAYGRRDRKTVRDEWGYTDAKAIQGAIRQSDDGASKGLAAAQTNLSDRAERRTLFSPPGRGYSDGGVGGFGVPCAAKSA